MKLTTTGKPDLPLDAVTRTFGILGQRGTGKTSAAVVMAEEMATAGGHVAILDPVGAWWGITHQGRRRGIEGIVIGGEHADVPLEESGGELVAKLVVERHWPVVVVDMKLMRKGAQQRFMADYLETLFHDNRAPLHQIFEEADRALPQEKRSFDPTKGRVLGAGEDIIKLGRSRGLGATLVSQRPATVNKNALEQVENLLIFRLMGPNDRKAIRGWIEANGDPAVTGNVMDSLSGMDLGEAWLYSPGFLRILERVKIRPRDTLDSSATPEVGGGEVKPTRRAPVDLNELRERMAETIERKKKTDPKELQRRISELESEVKKASSEERVVEVEVKVPYFPEELKQATLGLLEEVGNFAEMMYAKSGDVIETVANLIEHTKADWDVPVVPPPAGITQQKSRAPTASKPGPDRSKSPVDTNLAKAPLALLTVLVSRHPMKLSRPQLSTLSGYKPRSSTYANALSTLRVNGLIEEEGKGKGALIYPSQAGFDVFGGNPPEPPDAEATRQMWINSLPQAPRALLDYLLTNNGGVVSREDLAEATGYSITSSTFANALSTLRVNCLIEDFPDKTVGLSESLV